ncbi:MAG: hypothetical protein K6D97_04765 [Clostridia bacterium]|nr:hypothetical protein [Clostridia bacterium]
MIGKLFEDFWNKGEKRSTNKGSTGRYDYVNLVEPSYGRTIELQVVVENAHLAKFFMDQLMSFARKQEDVGATWEVIGDRKIRIIYSDGDTAEGVRQIFK